MRWPALKVMILVTQKDLLVHRKIEVDEKKHNHPQPNTLPRRKIIKKLKAVSLTTRSTTEAVAEAYLNKSPPSVKEINASRNLIYRSRKRVEPEPPETINLLPDIINEYKFLENYYLGNTTASDGSVALFFTSLDMLNALNAVEEINVAASYVSVPQTPSFSQLLSFHIKKDNQSIPALFVICSANTLNNYEAMWDFLHSKIENFGTRLKSIVCSYENDFVTATRNKLPNVSIKGSWFHFMKLWTRQWRSLNLPIEPLPAILKASWALPLLPSNKLAEGIKVIEFLTNCNEQYNAHLVTFVSAVKSWCTRLSNEISYIDNTEEGAINIAEDFLRHILNLIGYKKSLHTYLGKRPSYGYLQFYLN
ncbi:uncharacterized protein LOC123259740 [Cotesia glomerata]|uniref:uncharacterized protein LOC123259740 n=1 Tax=Cotesia glomerata TaxID=32391 RepID=UPI001D015836|nr:uncharacterized protein LOC123259740 [Cotesia glomerata]